MGYFAEQHNTEFNPDNHRYVPGDTVCVFDEYTGAFNVYECPPAPAGNWCCTVDLEATVSIPLSYVDYGNNLQIGGTSASGFENEQV